MAHRENSVGMAANMIGVQKRIIAFLDAKTSHTLNPVPCIIYDNTAAKDSYTVKADNGRFGLSNVAATMVNLMGYEAPAMWDESIIEVK